MFSAEEKQILPVVAVVGLAVLLLMACEFDLPEGDGTGKRCAPGEVEVPGLPGDPYVYCKPRIEVATPDAGAGMGRLVLIARSRAAAAAACGRATGRCSRSPRRTGRRARGRGGRPRCSAMSGWRASSRAGASAP